MIAVRQANARNGCLSLLLLVFDLPDRLKSNDRTDYPRNLHVGPQSTA
jgi:hypothetical protein